MPNESLITIEEQQPRLFSDLALEERIFQESEGRGEFTAERLFKRRADTYRAIVKLLARGCGQIFIGDLLSVSPSTVRAVAKREGIAIGIEKKDLAEQAFGVARLAAEVVSMKLADPKEREQLGALDAAKIMSLMSDRALVLAGEANVIVESKTPAKPQHDDFNAYLASLRVVNTPGMGLGAEKNGAQGQTPRDGADLDALGSDGGRDRGDGRAPGVVQSEASTDGESVATSEEPKETNG